MRISENMMMRQLTKHDLIPTMLKRRRVRRAMNKAKLTVLFGIITMVVLRGAFGIVKLGTAATYHEDFLEPRVDLSSQLVQSTRKGGKGVEAIPNLVRSEDSPVITLPMKKLLDSTNKESIIVDTENNIAEFDSNPAMTVVAEKVVVANDSISASTVLTEKVEDKSDSTVTTVGAEVEDESDSNPVTTVVAEKIEDGDNFNPITTVVAEKIEDESNSNAITSVVAEMVEDKIDSNPITTDSSPVTNDSSTATPVDVVEKEDDLEAMKQELSRLFGRKKRVSDSLTASENPRYTTILDWDEQRKKLNNNEKKTKILMVTGSQPQACQGVEGDHLLLRLAKNKMDFCRGHDDIELFYNMALTEPDMSGFWTKPPLIRRLMLARPDVEWIWWIDSDAVFTDMSFRLPMDKYDDYNMVVPGYRDLVFNDLNWVGLNTGSFLIRNCQWSLDLISAWSPIDWETTSRNRAGYLFSKTLSQRPDFEADDQSAFVYLITSEKEIWTDKLYFETAYDLSGYWVMLIDKYEDMLANNQTIPMVTHFVGCKPCGNLHHYGEDSCRQGMDRALYFADDQIVKSIGLKHDDFSTSRLSRLPTASDHLLPYI